MTTVQAERRGGRGVLALCLLAAGLGLSGCGGGVDGISDLNPFKREEVPLPGERRSLLPDRVAAEAAGRAASVAAPRSVGDWSQAGGGPANDPGNVAFSGSFSRAWSSRVGETSSGGGYGFGGPGQRMAARPVVSGGVAFVYSPNAVVTATSVDGGGRLWRRSVAAEGESAVVSGGGVAVSSGRVVASTGYGTVVALDAASGSQLWSAKLDAPARTAPAIAGNRVYVVSRTNSVTALDLASGAVAWTIETSGASAGLLSSTSPAVVGDTVFVPTSTGDVVALSAADGSQKWTVSVAGGSRSLAVAGLGDASASPVVSDGVLYGTGVGGRIVAARAASGERIWDRTVGSAHTPVVSGGSLFLVDLDGRAMALDRQNGQILWASPLPPAPDAKRTTWAGPLLAGGKLLFVSVDGRLAVVDAARGTIEQVTSIGVEGVLSPVASGGTILVLGGNGTMLALR